MADPLLSDAALPYAARFRLSKVCQVALGFVIFVFVVSAADSLAQLPRPTAPTPAKPDSTTPVDLLGRETPRRALIGLLKCYKRDDYETAARYFQPARGQKSNLTEVAKQFQALQEKFEGNIGLLSDDPNGTIETGLPPGQVRAGVLVVGGTTADVILVQADDPVSGKIWLISKDTVASIPRLYAQLESEAPTALNRIIPAALTGRRLLGISHAKWLGWLISIPISWLLAWLLACWVKPRSATASVSIMRDIPRARRMLAPIPVGGGDLDAGSEQSGCPAHIGSPKIT